MQLEHLHPPPRSTNLATRGFLFMTGTAEGGRSTARDAIEHCGDSGRDTVRGTCYPSRTAASAVHHAASHQQSAALAKRRSEATTRVLACSRHRRNAATGVDTNASSACGRPRGPVVDRGIRIACSSPIDGWHDMGARHAKVDADLDPGNDVTDTAVFVIGDVVHRRHGAPVGNRRWFTRASLGRQFALRSNCIDSTARA